MHETRAHKINGDYSAELYRTPEMTTQTRTSLKLGRYQTPRLPYTAENAGPFAKLNGRFVSLSYPTIKGNFVQQ